MTDQYGRPITYMRISVTDRCNLRCRYCMPDGICLTPHSAILTYEEILRVAREAVALGITRFKVTGGEPLARLGCVDFVRALKAIPGVEQVTMTTNGLLLPPVLEELCAAGLDAVNISLDTLNSDVYSRLTGYSGDAPATLLSLLQRCVTFGLRTKINVVLLRENAPELEALGMLAARLPVDVRFIELMPLGYGAGFPGLSADEALTRLKLCWPDLHAVDETRGNGPARYYAADGLQGRLGLIAAVSHAFCVSCNRVRLTSVGELKPCLCYAEGTDLKALLRSGADNAVLRDAMQKTIYEKPLAHCFSMREAVTERRVMSQIGG